MRFGKLETTVKRYEELGRLLQDPEVASSGKRYVALAREHGTLKKIVEPYLAYRKAEEALAEAQEILDAGDDEELVELARDELPALAQARDEKLALVQESLATVDEDSERDAIVEIRAGTGGTEACLFAADLFRMYSRYAENRGWKTEVIEQSQSDLDGFKSVTFSVSGAGAFKHLQFESGGHRVQRVPKTEAQGRIHTSAATVVVLPEAEEVDVEVNPSDLRIDLFHASGPGGQHVNKTQSAVRIIHEPTGIKAECQDEKSQHKNKARAMRILRSRIYEFFKEQKEQERGEKRRTLRGSGDRSQRVRTYNFPQNRVTDHRIGLSLYDLENLMLGQLDPLVEQLLEHDREERLRALTDE